ncbi:MAG: hypothetical protein MUD08_02245 [Cytophagales bacterium]|nr:hypothetical protein [Cytophagales bacterium]
MNRKIYSFFLDEWRFGQNLPKTPNGGYETSRQVGTGCRYGGLTSAF